MNIIDPPTFYKLKGPQTDNEFVEVDFCDEQHEAANLAQVFHRFPKAKVVSVRNADKRIKFIQDDENYNIEKADLAVRAICLQGNTKVIEFPEYLERRCPKLKILETHDTEDSMEHYEPILMKILKTVNPGMKIYNAQEYYNLKGMQFFRGIVFVDFKNAENRLVDLGRVFYHFRWAKGVIVKNINKGMYFHSYGKHYNLKGKRSAAQRIYIHGKAPAVDVPFSLQRRCPKLQSYDINDIETIDHYEHQLCLMMKSVGPKWQLFEKFCQKTHLKEIDCNTVTLEQNVLSLQLLLYPNEKYGNLYNMNKKVL